MSLHWNVNSSALQHRHTAPAASDIHRSGIPPPAVAGRSAGRRGSGRRVRGWRPADGRVHTGLTQPARRRVQSGRQAGGSNSSAPARRSRCPALAAPDSRAPTAVRRPLRYDARCRWFDDTLWPALCRRVVLAAAWSRRAAARRADPAAERGLYQLPSDKAETHGEGISTSWEVPVQVKELCYAYCVMPTQCTLHMDTNVTVETEAGPGGREGSQSISAPLETCEVNPFRSGLTRALFRTGNDTKPSRGQNNFRDICYAGLPRIKISPPSLNLSPEWTPDEKVTKKFVHHNLSIIVQKIKFWIS